MRIFWLKCVNVLLIAAVLFGYQEHAGKHDEETRKQEERIREAAAAWAEFETEQSSDGDDSRKQLYQDGTYQGSGTGYGGKIKVEVVLASDQISSVEIVSASGETPEYLEEVKKKLTEDVVREQSTDLDAVSGATLTSYGMLDAVEEALQEAQRTEG